MPNRVRCSCGHTFVIEQFVPNARVRCPACGRTGRSVKPRRTAEAHPSEAAEQTDQPRAQSEVAQKRRIAPILITTFICTASVCAVWRMVLIADHGNPGRQITKPIPIDQEDRETAPAIPLGLKRLDPAQIVPADGQFPERVGGQILVQLRPNAAPESANQILTDCDIDGRVVGYLRQLNEAQIESATPVTDAVVSRLRNHPEVRHVCLNTISSTARDFTDPVLTDTDPDNDWGLRMLDAPSAWEVATGKGVTLAIIDSGYKADHPDLAGRVNYSYSLFTGTSSMYAPDRFVNRDGEIEYSSTHGTHVAIIAGGAANGVGTVGVAPNAHLAVIQYVGPVYAGGRPVFQTADLHKAVAIAVDAGADVINMSFGWAIPPDVQARLPGDFDARAVAKLYSARWLECDTPAYRYAAEKNVIMVKAAGNDTLPAKYAGVPDDGSVIVVGAVTPSRESTKFSNYGPLVSVSAPGLGIYSGTSDPDQPYAAFPGTSMAAPFVAGTVALMREIKPDLSTREAIDILRESGTPVADKKVGPIVNAAAALDLLRIRIGTLSGTEGPAFRAHTVYLDDLRLSDDGRRAVSVTEAVEPVDPRMRGRHSELRYWDTETGRLLWSRRFPPLAGGGRVGDGVLHYDATCAISADGSTIAAAPASCSCETPVGVWSFASDPSNPSERAIDSGLISIDHLYFAPDGNSIIVNGHYPPGRIAALAGVNHRLRVFDLATGNRIGESPPVQSPGSIDLRPDNSAMALLAERPFFDWAWVSVHSPNWFRSGVSGPVLDTTGMVGSVRFEPSGSRVLVAAEDLFLWRPGSEDHTYFDRSSLYWRRAQFADSGRFVVAVSRDSEADREYLHIYRTSTQRQVFRLSLPPKVEEVAISGNGRVVAISFLNGEVRTWLLDEILAAL